ncbi:MAG: endo-1,3-alpha-glucanase family glycosylhydrolase [Salinivirgaceae bacterium]|jgi:hypothetical protein|nr:endo-1,3-alpha-glucanase family glycosylhydrolase [Salinivirgaceae bacterium]
MQKLTIIVSFVLGLFVSNINAQPSKIIDTLKNLPELGLPLSNEKLVIAHNMTDIIRFKGHELEDCSDPEYYYPKGNITENLGGMVQVNVMSDKYLKDSSLEQTIEFELRAAIKSGIDGFQFYYPLRKRGPDDLIIKTFFKVADEKNIDFKFTFCPSHPSGLTEDIKVKEYAKRMNSVLDAVGHDNSHWLRTPDGRLIVYLWYGEQIAEIPNDLQGLPRQFYIARALKRLSMAINENVAYVLAINYEISKDELNTYLDYVPAVWLWTLPYTDNYLGEMVATTCKERNRTFTGSVFSSFYTSKLLPPGTWDMHHYAIDAARAGIENVERRGIITGLSYNFRKLFEFAIDKDVPIINVITWNDYPEGHHIAPEVNHNFAWAVLINYYKSVWKGEPSPFQEKDVAITFFKKYKHNVKPIPYNIPIVYLSEAVPESYEDSVEVVTILSKPAELLVNNQQKKVGSGLMSSKFDHNPGPVKVTIKRGKTNSVEFTTPEWITDKPYRTDRLIYSFSSEFNYYHEAIFGNYPPLFSEEYSDK